MILLHCIIELLCICGLSLGFTTLPVKQTPALVRRQLVARTSYFQRSQRRITALKDLLGLGAPEIAICLVAGLVLFGPETLKSLSKDFGKAAAELKEIPKTFKEGMDEGSESVQISKMKAMAAAKRKKRDEKLAQAEAVADEVEEE